MLIERSQAVIGAVVAVLLVVGTVAAIGLSSGMFRSGIPLSAQMTDAAGVKSGDFVMVAGHRAGEVTGVELDGDQARVHFTLTAPDMPADSTAAVVLRSTVGTRALELDPGSAEETLAAGDHIPIERTDTPVDVPEVGDRSAELLGGVDVDALQELTTALADVTEDAADDVEGLLTGLEDVSRIVGDRREEITAVLEEAQTVVDAAADKDREIVTIIDEFGAVLERLVARRDDITRLLEETASTSTATADLVSERRDQIDRTLADLHRDLEIVDETQVDLAHTLSSLAQGLEGFAQVGYNSGEARVDNPDWGNVFTTGLGQVGVGALLDCGGTLDELFTSLIGPDPRCEDVSADQRSPGPGPAPEQGEQADDDQAPDDAEEEPGEDSLLDSLGSFLGLEGER